MRLRFDEVLAREGTLLAEGSVFELLRRDWRIRFDPQIAHSGLIYDGVSRALLAAVHGRYMRIAREAGRPIVAFADTWRASAARVEASPFRGRDVNGDNVDFLREVAARSGARVVLGALTGPRGDAYRPEEAPGAQEAAEYHAAQIEALAAADVDLIVAATLPALDEARGIASLLSRVSIPWMLSFVVRPSGVLLDGTPLETAVRSIDGLVPAPPIGYSINCVHPAVAQQALSRLSPDARRRVIAFQGNTSARTPEELDNLPEIDSTAPEAFAASTAALVAQSSIRMVGGCCGTDGSHMTALARALNRH